MSYRHFSSSPPACNGGQERGLWGEPAVLAWPLSTKSAEARTHFEDGQAANDRGRPLKAYEQFKRSVAADSAFALGYLGVAQRALSLDEYRTNLLRATAYEAGANETEKLLIDIERKEFDRDQQAALALAQQLAAKQPGNPRSWWVLAGEYRSTGQTEASRASLKKAIDLAPEYGATHLIYAQDYTVNQPTDLATAEQQVLAGGKIWPREPLSYDYLGDVRRAQGRLEEAAAAYGRQIELDPQNFGGYIQRAHSYTFLGEYDKARADYDAAIRVASGNEKVFTARCKAYVSAFAGNPDDALKQLDQLSQAIDGMGVPEPEGEKIETLNSEAIIATYAHRFDIAEKALGQARPLVLHSVQRVGTPEFRRGQGSRAGICRRNCRGVQGRFCRCRGQGGGIREARRAGSQSHQEPPGARSPGLRRALSEEIQRRHRGVRSWVTGRSVHLVPSGPGARGRRPH